MEYVVILSEEQNNEVFKGSLKECVKYISGRWDEYFIIDKCNNIIDIPIIIENII